MERDRFKLDAAAINDRRDPNVRILVYNFNIPFNRLRDLATFEFVRQELERDFPLEADGIVVPSYFQLSAVYVLVNTTTNEERVWCGSFHPRGRDLAQLTAFRAFEPAVFPRYVLENSEPEHVANKLATFVNGQDSVWRYDRLISVVVSFQTTLHLRHPLFERHARFREHGQAGPAKKNWKTYTTFFD